MPRVINGRRENPPDDAVYIGRPSRWGNRFVIGVHGTRAEVIARFQKWATTNPKFVAAVQRELRGRDLVCSCAPKPCHGDVLISIANAE